VVLGKVGERVVDDVVLVVPVVGGTTEQVAHGGHDPVDPGAARIGSVPAVVHDVEAQARDGVAITGEKAIEVTALEDSELVLVDAA